MGGFTQQQADAVLQRALELSDEARERFLDESCGTDPAMRTLVERLLRAGESDDAPLTPGGGASGPLWEELTRQLTPTTPVEPGDRLGAYRIVRTLGRGGMATVYLARRADGQFEHTVALKVLDATRNFEELAIRFAQERQILATLNHPNIARLIDGGVTPSGQPYVVMEYVDGEPIDAYCDRLRLTIAQRIALLGQVAAAVHYAHGHLIVHRDIKPSNILVTADGQPKLLDFGIAKLLDPSAPHAAPETRNALHLMTPEYASPEQVRGQPLTTASDAYQLGYLLYQLLTGRAPYGATQGRSFAEVVRVICSAEAVRPSEAVMSSQRDASSSDRPSVDPLSVLRSTTPQRLRRELSGDLDRITLMALRKEPEQRYESVYQLCDDLRRHAEGLPVTARPPTLRYRTAKFLRRHARGVAAAAATLAFVVTLVAWYTVQLAWERDRATAQFERAERARDFLVSVIDQSNPVRATGSAGQPNMRDLLRYARDRVETELADQPELQAEMGIAVARALHGVGEVAPARELLEKSIDQLRELGATNTLWFGRGMSKLGTMRSDLGDLTGGEAAFRESIAVLESLPASAEVGRQLILARTGLANLMQRAGRAAEAVVMREEILKAHLELVGDPEHPDLAWDWFNLAIDYQSVGRFADAEAPLRTAERLTLAAYGESDPRMLHFWLLSSSLLALRGKFDESADYERKSEGLLVGDLYADAHPLRAAFHRNRARRQLFLGDMSAIASARKAVEIYRRAEHFAVGSALATLGTTLLVDGRFREAADAFAEAHAVKQEQKGAGSADTRLQYVGRAVALWRLSGDADDLEDAVATASMMLRGDQGDAIYLADAAAWVAAALETEDPARAAKWHTNAEKALAAVYPTDHPWRTSLAGTRR